MGKLSALRVVDPVLTNLIQGFSNSAYVADEVFPVVDVDKEAGKIPELTTEHFKLWNTKRAIHGDSNVAQLKFMKDPVAYVLDEHDFGVPVDYREEQEAAETLSLQQHAAMVVSEVLTLRREKAVADLVQNASKYTVSNTSSPTTKWNQASSTPVADIRAAAENIRQRIGRKPNRAVIPADVWAVLQDHPDFLDRVKHTQLGIVTEELVASILQVEKVVIGGASYETDAGVMTKIWTDGLVLAHVTPGVRAQRNPLIPSFGYTLMKRGFPQADKYMKEGNKVQVVRGTYIEGQLFHGNVAGYYLSNVLA